MKDEAPAGAEKGYKWNTIVVPQGATLVIEFGERKDAPRNAIKYTAGRKETTITVSGVEYSPDIAEVSAGSRDTRTMTFPNTVREVR